MECVCLLLDVPISWDSAKKVLGDSQFMQKLINYDKDNMDRKIVKKMLKYYDDPEFTPENVQVRVRVRVRVWVWVWVRVFGFGLGLALPQTQTLTLPSASRTRQSRCACGAEP